MANFDLNLLRHIDGWLDPGQEQWLYDKAAQLPDGDVMIEIGSYHGRSSAALGLACKDTNKKLFCVDIWPERHFAIWLNNITKLGLLGTVIPLRGKSTDILPPLRYYFKQFSVGFAFIDADHHYAPVIADYECVVGLVKQGGWIAFHDVCQAWPEVITAWEMLKSDLQNHESCANIRCGQHF